MLSASVTALPRGINGAAAAAATATATHLVLTVVRIRPGADRGINPKESGAASPADYSDICIDLTVQTVALVKPRSG
jgi:hypothetical protein